MIFVIVVPFLGAFVYLIAKGQGMADRTMAQAKAQQAQMDDYVRPARQAAAPRRRSRRPRDSSTPARSRRPSSSRSRRRRSQRRSAPGGDRKEQRWKKIGPVDYAVIAFPGNQFKGEIAPALAELTDSGTIRIIDVAFVGKSAGGDTVAMELTELISQVKASLDKLGIEVGGLFNEDDLQDIADDLEPDFSAAVLLGERLGEEGDQGDARCRRRARRLRADPPRARAGCPRVGARAGERIGRRPRMFGRRGPGLVRAAATTAVVAGTAGAVRHRQDQKYAAQDQAAYDQQMAAEQAAVSQQQAAATPAVPDYAAELQQLAALKGQGLITEEEFEAKKKQILGI